MESQLAEYLCKFRNRLSASNRRYIEQMVVVVQALLAYIHISTGASSCWTNEIVTGGDDVCLLRSAIGADSEADREEGTNQNSFSRKCKERRTK